MHAVCSILGLHARIDASAIDHDLNFCESS
jgi:hypothetical protein